jgi:hypothetical protein
MNWLPPLQLRPLQLRSELSPCDVDLPGVLRAFLGRFPARRCGLEVTRCSLEQLSVVWPCRKAVFRHICRSPRICMAQQSKPQTVKTQQLTLDLSETGFETILFFNRFGIENGDTHVLVHFGYVARSGDVLGSFTAAFPKTFLEANAEDWKDYIGKVGDPPERPIDASWRPTVGQSRRVEVVNAMRLARLGVDAELRCYAASIVSIVDRTRGGVLSSKPVQSQPIAWLQSSLEEQQLLLLALIKYKEL